MDYAGLNAGVKVMLPVNEPGALLFLGDGHARQGEGEVVGTGLETSLDVEFTVELVKKKADRVAAARERHAHHGARQRPAAAAKRSSTRPRKCSAGWSPTTGSPSAAPSSLMGQALEYEVANVVDPNFTMVAKVRKSLLQRR